MNHFFLFFFLWQESKLKTRISPIFFTFIFFFITLLSKNVNNVNKVLLFKICTLIYITFGMEILSQYWGEELQGVINTLEDYSFIELSSSSRTKKQVNNEKFVKIILECCQKYIWIFSNFDTLCIREKWKRAISPLSMFNARSSEIIL